MYHLEIILHPESQPLCATQKRPRNKYISREESPKQELPTFLKMQQRGQHCIAVMQPNLLCSLKLLLGMHF